MRYKCDNCKMLWDREECPDVGESDKRFDVGGPYTDKECPECGALAYRLPGMKVRWVRRGSHIHMTVFMGDDIEHLANCGNLTMRDSEFELFRKILFVSADSEEFEDKAFELRFEEASHGLDMP